MEDWLEPLYDADAMRAADRWAIEDREIPSLELMEAAGRALAGAALELAAEGPARIVCGKGNNGGDGIVAARHLARMGLDAEVLLLGPASELSGDAAANRDRLAAPIREVESEALDAALAGSGVIVDAILGTGSAGAPREPAAGAIEAINRASAPVAAADIPSGVDASTGEVAGVAVRADVTVTFHAAKLGQWIAPGKRHVGDLRVAAIGIPDGAPTAPVGGLISARALALAPRRDASSTKFSSGQVLVAGGSRGLTGAVCMVAEAAARSGAGYVTVAVPAELEPIFEVKLTEAMSRGCASRDGSFDDAAAAEIAVAAERAGAVVLGPGLGREDRQRDLVRALATAVAAPLVIDADGLNAIAGGLDALAGREAPTILTPHAGELGRLLGRDSDEVGARRLAAAREAAERSGAFVVLKGDDTIVAGPGEELAINDLASPALATAGTGDVLAGMIGALLARGMDAFAATGAGVRAHARAGLLAGEKIGAAESVVAGDVIAAIPAALGPEPSAGERS